MTISTDESSKTIHVFASDFLPFPGCPRTAGGNRSMQIISALRRAGHKVTYSMPLVSDMAKKNVSKIEPPLTAEEIWLCDNFFDPDFVLNRVQPDVAIYCNINCFRTVRRFSKDIVHILDLYGPLQFEGLLLDTNDPAAAMHDGPGLERRCREMVDKIRDIDYLVTVSERQKYFWSAYCTLAGFSFQELNVLVCPTSFDVPAKPRNTASNLTVVYSGGFYPWQNPDRSLRAAATLLDEIPGAVLHIYGGPHPGLPNEPEVRQMLAELQQHKCVQYHGYRPVEELLSTLSTAWCALELMEQNLERELAITGRTVEFLSTGTPVIYNNYATISKLIEGYRAGWTLSPEDPFAMRSVFRELVEGGPARVEELSGNARRLAAIEFSESRATAALVDLCSRPVAKRSGTKATGSKAKSAGASRSIGRVLAISPDANALVELRISNPLRGMQRQGLIDGMVITNPSCESLRNDHSSYDAVIVQRAVPRYIYHTLANLAIDFVQDIDDNTLARAAYRRGIPPEIEILDGLHHCKVLSTPNPRLVRGLEKYSGIPLAHKAFITPNALPYPSPPQARVPAQPSQIIWIQSDIAALAESRDAVVRAVEDFSTKHRLPVVLIGKNVLERPQFRHQVVLGQIDFATNLQMLELGATSIGVAPLETQCDQETLDFIAGKSDLKMLLFAGYGHPGVYSSSPPYSDSGLQSCGILVDNSYPSWLHALEYQYDEGWKNVAEGMIRIQSGRNSDRVARESWAPALQNCVLPRPIRGSELYDGLMGSQKMLDSPARSVAYLMANHDVALGYLKEPAHSPWDHYKNHGFRERRSVMHDPGAHRNTLSDIERESAMLVQRAAERMSALTSQAASLQQAVDTLQRQSQGLQHAAESLEREVAAMRNSYSWKITAPLRSLAKPLLEK